MMPEHYRIDKIVLTAWFDWD